MKSIIFLSALLGLTSAAPRPQLIDTEGVDAAPDAVFVVPAYDVLEEAGAINKPAIAPRSRLRRRDGNCATQPAGSGPVSSPDTPEAFLSNPVYAALAENATTPDGYSVVMQNGGASLSASNYMGLKTLKSFDTLGCASLCDQASGCQAFNMYIERDPSLDPNVDSCPNPPSITNFKCTLWGAAVSAAEATNTGQWRDSFRVVIAGSNAYNKATPPPAVSCYTGPTELGGAINAPYNAQGQNTYMGYKYHPFSQTQGYDPSTCAADCNAQTAYNKRHPAADGSYQTCVFFNAYVLSVNGVPQGLYCSMYSQVWAASYATNYGQYRGTDRYTVSRSYSYSLNMAGDGSGSCGFSTTSQSSTLQSSTSRSSTSQVSTSQASTSQSSTSQASTSQASPSEASSSQSSSQSAAASSTTAQTSSSSTTAAQVTSSSVDNSVTTSPNTETQTTAASTVDSQTTISQSTTSMTETTTSQPTASTTETTNSQPTTSMTETVKTTTTPESASSQPTSSQSTMLQTTSDIASSASSTSAISTDSSSSSIVITTKSESATTQPTTTQSTTSQPTSDVMTSDSSTSIVPTSSSSSSTSNIVTTTGLSTSATVSTASTVSTSLTSITSSTSTTSTASTTSTTSVTSTASTTSPTSTTSTASTTSITTTSIPNTSTTTRSSSTTTHTTSSSSTTSPSSTPAAGFCLQNPSTLQFASVSKNGNGLSFSPTTPKSLPSLFTLDASSRLTSSTTGVLAVLNLATFGTDGTTEGHIEGTTPDQLNVNQNYKPLVCDVASGTLKCRSAANYINPAKTPATRSQLDTTTKGNDGVDRFVFAPTSVAGAVAVKVLPASACGPNYS